MRAPHWRGCAARQVTIAKAGTRPTGASEVSLNARVSATLTISVLVFLRAQHPYPGQRAAQDSPHTCRDWVRDKSHSCATPDALKHQCLRVARNVAYCSAVCTRPVSRSRSPLGAWWSSSRGRRCALACKPMPGAVLYPEEPNRDGFRHSLIAAPGRSPLKWPGALRWSRHGARRLPREG